MWPFTEGITWVFCWEASVVIWFEFHQSLFLGVGVYLTVTQAGAPACSHWLATRLVIGCRRDTSKCLIFWDIRPLNNSADTEYSWMPPTHLTGWFFIFSVQIWAITPVCRFSILSNKDFWIKLMFMFYIHPDGRQHFANVTPLSRARVIVVLPLDHPWRHQTSRESRDHHYDAQLIYRIQKSLLPRTMHFS